jgi:hypothetical protein
MHIVVIWQSILPFFFLNDSLFFYFVIWLIFFPVSSIFLQSYLLFYFFVLLNVNFLKTFYWFFYSMVYYSYIDTIPLTIRKQQLFLVNNQFIFLYIYDQMGDSQENNKGNSRDPDNYVSWIMEDSINVAHLGGCYE